MPQSILVSATYEKNDSACSDTVNKIVEFGKVSDVTRTHWQWRRGWGLSNMRVKAADAFLKYT